jgi:hypothetical protein
MNALKNLALWSVLLFHRARVFLGGMLFALVLTLGCSSLLAQANPDQALAPGSNYVDVGRGIPWGTLFNRAYILTPTTPNSSVCIYVVNNNPTSSHTFSLSVFQSADQRVTNNYSANTGRFQTVVTQGSISPVAAGSMSSSFVVSTAAAAIAFQFSGATTQAGSPDTADVFLVQTSNSSCGTVGGITPIQGAVASGSSGLTENPVLVAGLDNGSIVRSLRVIPPNDEGSGRQVQGLSIGVSGITPFGLDETVASVTFPSGSGGGPLAILPYGAAPDGTQFPVAITKGSRSADGQQQRPELAVAPGGFYHSISFGTLTTTTTQNLWQGSNFAGIFTSCWINADVTVATGTTPTLDLFLQDSGDGTHFDDRIHFTQITGTGFFASAIATSAGFVSHAMQDGVLAAGTIVNGPLGPYGRLKLVVGGTTPSFTVQVVSNCK